MNRNYRAWLGAVVLTLAAQVQVAPARAADLTTYLPNDSEFVVRVNFEQLRESPLVKKHVLDQIKAGLKKDDVQKVLTALGFDPLKDIDALTVAGPVSSDLEKLLVIANGKFDVDKFQKVAEEVAKNMADVLKITKSGDYKIWEVSPPNVPNNLPPTGYVVLVDKTTMLFTWGKSTLKDALAKASGKKKTELKKELATLVAKADTKQSLNAMVLTSAIGNADFIPGIEKAKAILDDLKTLTIGLTIAEDIKFQTGIGTKDADAAKKLSKGIKQGLLAAPAIIGLAAMQQEKIAPFVDPLTDLLKTIKVTTKGATVTVSATISKELMEKLEKAAKMAQADQ